jgi:hypothetical protein
MHRQGKLLLTALTMALVLALGAGSAMASRSLSITGTQTTTLTGRLLFSEQVEIRCDVTLDKRFNRAIPKTEGAQLGNVTRFAARECRTPAGYTLTSIRFPGVGSERQWILLYKTFLGTLPNITGFLYVITRMQILVEATNMLGMLARCLYENPRETTIPMLATLGGAQEITRLDFVNVAALLEFPLLRALPGSEMCQRGARIELSLTPTQSTTVLLI